MSARGGATHDADADLQSHPLLLALQATSDSKLAPLYERVSNAGGMVLLPPQERLPRDLDEKYARAHLLLPATSSSPATTAAGTPTAAAAASANGASDEDGATPAVSASGLSLWTNLHGDLVQITDGLVYVATEGTRGAPRARILFEELHYTDDFAAFHVLALDSPMTIEAQPRKRSRAFSNATQPPTDAGPSGRPELLSLSDQRDVLTQVLGETIATRCIFASSRLDYFFSDFSLAWLGVVATQPTRSATHIQAACARCMQESITAIKDSKRGSSGSIAGTATAKSLATWSATMFARLEVAIQCHVLSCLHSKIFATLVKLPVHKQSQESFTKTMAALGAVSLFDVGVSPHLVGLCDPRPAVDHMKLLNSLVTPLERLACLQKVEALLLDSMTQSTKHRDHLRSTAAAAAAQQSSSPSSSLTTAVPIKIGATKFSTLGAPARLASSVLSSSPILAPTALSSSPSATAVTGVRGSPLASSFTPQSRSSSFQRARAMSLSAHGTGDAASTPGLSRLNPTLAPLSSSPPCGSHAGASVAASILAASVAKPTNGLATGTDSTQATPPAAATEEPEFPSPSKLPAASFVRPRRKSSTSGPVSVSADDLLPLLVYVILESKPAHVHANIAYMRNFSPQAALLSATVHSELHYRLANFEAAVLYIESGKLQQQMSLTSRAQVKKGRLRMSSISVQSTQALQLLLTPVSSHRRNLFRRRTSTSSAVSPTQQLASSTSSGQSSRKGSDALPPPNGRHRLIEGDETLDEHGDGDGGEEDGDDTADSTEHSMFDLDIEGEDEDEDDQDLIDSFSAAALSPRSVASDGEVDFGDSVFTRSAHRLRSVHSADPISIGFSTNTGGSSSGNPTQLFETSLEDGDGTQLPSWLTDAADYVSPRSKRNTANEATLASIRSMTAASAAASNGTNSPANGFSLGTTPLSINGVSAGRVTPSADNPLRSPLTSPLVPLRGTLDDEEVDPLGAVKKKPQQQQQQPTPASEA